MEFSYDLLKTSYFDIDIERPRQEILEISSFTSNILKNKMLTIPSPYTNEKEFFLTAFQTVVSTLPIHILRQIQNFRSNPYGPSSLIIRGLPVDNDLGSTPADGGRAINKKTFISEGIIAGIGQNLGNIFSYPFEKNGEMIHNICPVQGRQKAMSNEGSASDFRLHTEVAFMEYRPQFLSLFCLRGDRDHQAATTVADIRDALPFISSELMVELRKSQFQIGAPQSFSSGSSNLIMNQKGAVIYGKTENPEVRLNFNSIKGLSCRADEALKELEAILCSQNVLKKIKSVPGDLVLIDNRKAVHGRTPFQPYFDGQDRWLHRIYVHQDSWQLMML